MLPKLGPPVVAAIIAALPLVTTHSAAAQGTGGAVSPRFASVTSIRCLPSPAAPCRASRAAVAGGKMRLRGRGLLASRSVVFRGARGPTDDTVARIGHSGPRHAEARVPIAARTGPVRVVTDDGVHVTASRRLRVQAAERLPGDTFFAGDDRRPKLSFDVPTAGPMTVEVVGEEMGDVVDRLEVQAQAGTNVVAWDGRITGGPAPNGRYSLRLRGTTGAITASTGFFHLFDHVFPIRGKHDRGQSMTNDFGGGRGHRGLDMFASCGTPLVAVRRGKVREAGYNTAAGNYAVISSRETGLDYVYMHMKRAALVRTGDVVSTRQPLGEVGDSGNASGCHLHFELWDAPGWYVGGSAFDPKPLLSAWDEWS